MSRPPLPAPRIRLRPGRLADDATDSAPLSARQLWALSAAAARELTWGLPSVARHVRRWQALAAQIPDAPIRDEALAALRKKRSHIDGAALFSIIPRVRKPALLGLLVAYEIIWDFLDSINERSATSGLANGLELHGALVAGIDPSQPQSSYFQHCAWRDDGGYLQALVAACRTCCGRSPSYIFAREHLIREAIRGQICAINHDPDPGRRDSALEMWAKHEMHPADDTLWFELTAAASTDLTIFALLAASSEATCVASQMHSLSRAYFPWASSLAAMLDSYVDQEEDAANRDHNYFAHYHTPEHGTQRICALMRRSLLEARTLSAGEKHTLIVASMFAMYLSKSSAISPATQATTRRMVESGGSLTHVLHPILRLWRTVYGLRSS